MPVPPIDVEPSLPPSLNQAILRSLAKDPSERFLSADEFRETLLQVKPNTAALPSRLLTKALTGKNACATRIASCSLSWHSHSWLWSERWRSLFQRSPRTFEFPRPQIIGAAAAFVVVTFGVTGFIRGHAGHVAAQPPAAVAVNRPEMQAQKAPAPAIPPPEPIPARPPEADNSRRPAVANRAVAKRAVARAATTSAAVRESALERTPAISNAMLQPLEERPVTQPIEPPPLVQTEQKDAILPFEAPPPAPTDTYTEPTPKPESNGLKKGLGKLWRIVRHKKPSSEDSASSTDAGRQ